MPETSSTLYHRKPSVQIEAVSAKDEGLLVRFENGGEQLFSWFWVRDHGTDQESLDHETLQRKVDTFSLSPSIKCRSLDFDKLNQSIDFTWSEGATSSITAQMLAGVTKYGSAPHALAPKDERVFWDKNKTLVDLPENQFNDVMQSDEGLLRMLENIHIYGFTLIHGVPSNEQDSRKMAERIGIVQETIFGKMWPLSSDLTDHGDTAYSNSFLEPHTDGCYYHDAAGLQMFNCFEVDCIGGESVQVDGFAVAHQLKQDDPQAYETLSKYKVPAHYIEPGVHLRAERPVFSHNQKGELIQVTFNNYDRAPFMLPPEDEERFNRAYALFHRYANDQDNWLKIPLSAGTTLIFDNWRNMHGRMAYRGKRVFYGCYHSRAEFESKLRTLYAAIQ